MNEDTIVTISGEGILDSDVAYSSFTVHASSISDFIDVSLTVVGVPQDNGEKYELRPDVRTLGSKPCKNNLYSKVTST